MRIRKPKPRKVQKYPEFWYRPDNGAIIFLDTDGSGEIMLDGTSRCLDIGWMSSSGLTARESLISRNREFIGEVKP